jgi:Ca2+-binding EF-hand superfamily protein
MLRFAPQLALLAFSLATPLVAAGDEADLFNRLDANRDGQLVATEVPQEQLSLFKRLVRTSDKNHDGLLNLREFETGLTPARPEKPLTEKVENKLPGSEALLLTLTWMDLDADLVVVSGEVTPEMRPLFDEFVDFLNLKDKSRLPIAQISRQAIPFAGKAARFITREGIDVEVEMALLSDQQAAYVERLRHSLSGRDSEMSNPEGAFVLFSQLDSNGDGNVTTAEVPEAFGERFADLLAHADHNQDNQLSEQEFKKFTSRMAAIDVNRPLLAVTIQRAQQLIRRSDRNSDDLLSRQEAPPRIARHFARLDQNGDGQLDPNEVARGVEILEILRSSAAVQPASTPAKRPRPQNPRQN